MTIYTLTFHWATNYGAVLQAYALQQFLLKNGFDAKIIDYIPKEQKKTLLRAFRARTIKKLSLQLREYRKECNISKFRNKYLLLTDSFESNYQLQNYNWGNDIFICGSDQIWNPFFTLKGENRITKSYFLDFAPEKSLRIAYAASFGVENLGDDVVKIIEPLLSKFSYITVRENSAKRILADMKYNSYLVCDPVFLLERTDYERLLQRSDYCTKNTLFSYILHQNQNTALKISEFVSKTMGIEIVRNMDTLGVEEWLEELFACTYVVTNSFHAIAFSIIFHKPFIAILIEGSGMNDRIITLLEGLELSDYIVMNFNKKDISEKIKKPINWLRVDSLLGNMKNTSSNLLKHAIME